MDNFLCEIITTTQPTRGPKRTSEIYKATTDQSARKASHGVRTLVSVSK